MLHRAQVLRSVVAALTITAGLGLAGCHSLRGSCHDPKPYMKAQSVPPLQIPAGLDTPDTANALHIPRLNEPELPPRHGKDPCLDQPPDFRTPKPAPAPQA
ncbi:MAG TPA: hypothetical protein VJQ47_07685 [Steroidobacteraceae bacterium]|nr:hypothetical protein [Steroidobacteraceae bacterium]